METAKLSGARTVGLGKWLDAFYGVYNVDLNEDDKNGGVFNI